MSEEQIPENAIPMSAGEFTYGFEDVLLEHYTQTADNFAFHVGTFCSIAKNVRVLGSCNHRTDWITTFPFGKMEKETFTNFDGSGGCVSKGPIHIGHDVWIGMNATLQSGITIGDGAVVAANSHVVKSVPPYAIVGGNPARIIKMRFTQPQREALLRVAWWFWPDEKINEELPLLCSGNIHEFLMKHDETYHKQQETVESVSSGHTFWGC